jgi:hypothetical protein
MNQELEKKQDEKNGSKYASSTTCHYTALQARNSDVTLEMKLMLDGTSE